MGFIQHRQIKFRDFDLDTNTVRYFDLDKYDRNEHDCYGNITEFTGLKDKNGKDIYEGDLITIIYPYSGKTAKGVAVIVFSNNYVGGWVATVDYKITLNIGTRLNYIEVVGNVYENADLVPTAAQHSI